MSMRNVDQIFAQAKSGDLWAGILIPDYQPAGEKLPNISPIDNARIGDIAAGTEADIDAAAKAARNCFQSGEWSRLAPAERKRIMLRWADLMEEHVEELAALDCVDAGKPITECLNTDLPATLDTFRWYAEAVDKLFGRISPTGPEALGLIVSEPIGVVGAVLPWNFPAQMYAWKVAPALAAGNSVIVKPAELTSLSAYRMTQLAYEAGIPAGALTLVTGLGEVAGKALGLHPDVDVVSFTGSTEVGRLFLKYSADSNLKEIVLECGGKSPQVVFDDADLDGIEDHILAAGFWNMGENCSCGSRLIVHRDIRDALLERLKASLSSWKVGLPTDRKRRSARWWNRLISKKSDASRASPQQGARLATVARYIRTWAVAGISNRRSLSMCCPSTGFPGRGLRPDHGRHHFRYRRRSHCPCQR